MGVSPVNGMPVRRSAVFSPATGKVYRSLSSAALAAAKDLGLNNKTQNGFTFWGLSKPPRRPSDPLVALDRAWERYHGNVDALVPTVPDSGVCAP